MSACCSIACAFAEPVAGLALPERFTDSGDADTGGLQGVIDELERALEE